MNITLDEDARRRKWFQSHLCTPGAYLIPWLRAAFARGARKVSVRISHQELLCTDNGQDFSLPPGYLLERMICTPASDTDSYLRFTELTQSHPEYALLLTPGPTELSFSDRENRWVFLPEIRQVSLEKNLTPHSPRLRLKRPALWAGVEREALGHHAQASLYPLSINEEALDQYSYLPPCLLRYRIPGQGEFGLLLKKAPPFIRWLNQGIEDSTLGEFPDQNDPRPVAPNMDGWAAAIEYAWFRRKGWEGVMKHIQNLLTHLPSRWKTMTPAGRSRARDLLLESLPQPNNPSIEQTPLWKDVNTPDSTGTLLCTRQLINLPSPLLVTPFPSDPKRINPNSGTVIEIDGICWNALKKLKIPQIRWTFTQNGGFPGAGRRASRWLSRHRTKWLHTAPDTPPLPIPQDNPWFILEQYLKYHPTEQRFLELLTSVPNLGLALLPPGHSRPYLHPPSKKLLLPDILTPDPSRTGDKTMMTLLALLHDCP